MPCYHPLTAVVLAKEGLSGKKVISLSKRALSLCATKDNTIQLPCGKCRGCRHDRARQWAIRCVHESQLHDKNCFITLTFDEKHVNKKGSLVKSDFQNFMKRLRKHFYGNQKSDIKYYHCGEYGEQFERPHHHACLFNFDFPDKQEQKTKNGRQYFQSPILSKLWDKGMHSIGPVTYDSAAYVARYIIKKINGELAPGHYQGRLPEYTTMSRRPAIGLDWYKKYHDTDLYPRDYVALQGVTQKIPKFYDLKYELTNPLELASLKLMRLEKAKVNPNNNPENLRAAEKIQEAYDNMYHRTYEKHTQQTQGALK